MVFEQQKEKESIWARIRENSKKSQVVVTQFENNVKTNHFEAKSIQSDRIKTKAKNTKGNFKALTS